MGDEIRPESVEEDNSRGDEATETQEEEEEEEDDDGDEEEEESTGGDEYYSRGDEEEEEEEALQARECSSEDDSTDGESFLPESIVLAVSLSLNKRIRDDNSIDRLSRLPDDLLIRILSHLGMKGAATTSVLSKRWQYLWHNLPNLRFEESSTRLREIRKLVARIHRTLVLRSGNHLDELWIDFSYDESFAYDVNTWVEFAVRNKVNHLTLKLDSFRDFYVLPLVVCSCSSLVRLSMKGCIVAPKSRVNWQGLTDMLIEDVSLDEDDIQKILSACPVLSRLGLRGCWGYSTLDIGSQNLVELSVAESEEVRLLEISAPYVRSLDISIYTVGMKLRLRNMTSLVTAFINFAGDVHDSLPDSELVMKLFEDIQNVKKLELGCLCIKVLARLVSKSHQLPQSRRDSLIIKSWKDEDSISGILALLESSPCLETLVVQCSDFNEDSYEETIWTLGPAVKDLDCDLLHLKRVQFLDCADPNLEGEPMLTLARILLKQAPVLETIVVDGNGYSPDESLNMAQALHSCPRSSQKAIITFNQ